MNKRKVGRTFSRKRGVRKAFLKSLVCALLLHKRIATTDARAREVRAIAERMITHAKKQTLASRRLLTAQLGKVATDACIAIANERYGSRHGGYVRILKKSPRKSDGAKLAIIEFI